ncbi:MAG: GDP-mannose 4,6-dehydratase [Puniceicoccaceae bacterium]|nr:GDP-mannose 4,6-dehydratase [Puniceicoccaceae bacterium]
MDRLTIDGHQVIGVDNFDPFYNRSLKTANITAYVDHSGFELLDADLADSETYQKLDFLVGNEPVDAIIHLAAKVGVRPSIEDPDGYQRANVIVTQNLLEFAKDNDIKQFVFASSSSVYGVNPNVPWREDDHVLQPISPYASTKVSCELLGHVYSHLYSIRFLGLRFFTVYGPRQRPDLAINKFMRLIEAGESIPVFGDGSTRRDYTFIADTVDGIIRSLYYTGSNYEVINLGNDQSITLADMVDTIETVVGKKACIDRHSEQPGDVSLTWADIRKARELLGYDPKTKFADGMAAFYNWYQKGLEDGD